MPTFKPTVLEIASGTSSDVELLDFMLDNFGVGKVARDSRLLNIRRFEHVQLTLNGKVYQPFRADYRKNADGHWFITCRTRYESAFAKEFVAQLGFTLVNIELGDGEDYKIPAGMQMVQTGTLNGRSAEVRIGSTT